MQIELSVAPIQGITDYIFRNAFARYFNGIDKYYAPYLRLDKDLQFKESKLRDILPENNQTTGLIPQIMTNSAVEFSYMADRLLDFGYTELNWNLGCPYPMVTNRKLGAGLLPHHEEICSILDNVLSKTNMKVSIKMRSGLADDSQIETLLPLLNTYPLSEIIIHPRYAKQLYKGIADINIYKKCIALTQHKLCYNGDIDSLNYFCKLKPETGRTNHFMIGRGIVTNPFLAKKIKTNSSESINDQQLKNFWDFEHEIFESIQSRLSGPTQVLTKMKGYWEYFAHAFTNSHKVYKRFKKAKNINAYHEAISYIKNNEEWIY